MKMKRNKSHRKSVFHKIKHNINIKIKKAVAKRTREHTESQVPNRK
jgi:hypothetical protein